MKLKTLSNGLRILAIPQPQAPTVTALVLVGVGGDYEAKEQSGLSHFLEHLFFKGTTRRPSTKSIAEVFDRVGAVSNAFTTEEFTGFFAKGAPQHLELFLDVLSDIYLNPTFPEAEIVKEKGVVIEEMNMYEDSPQYLVARELTRLLYGDQSAGRPLIGTKETIKSFTRDNVVAFKDTHYHAANTVVVVVGPVTQSVVHNAVARAFKAISVAKKRSRPRTKQVQSVPAVSMYTKQTDQVHIALAFRTVALGHADLPALRLLATILGRSMSSRLFLRLREELGAAYYVNAGQETLTDRGEFGITAGIDKDRVPDIVGEILKELKLLKEELVSKDELSKARQYALGMMRLGLESTDDLANFYGYAAILDQPFRTPALIAKEYSSVTPRDIRRIAQKYFVSNRANLAIVGPTTTTKVTPQIFDSL